MLADLRLLDAEVLYGAGRYAGAYYLSGYAVECGLKAAIARETREHDFPELRRAHSAHTHDLAALLQLAGLADALDRERDRSSAFDASWATIKDWVETCRYRHDIGRKMAGSLLEAVRNPDNGMLPWIRKRW